MASCSFPFLLLQGNAWWCSSPRFAGFNEIFFAFRKVVSSLFLPGLILCAFSDRSATASALLSQGASVNAIDDKGRTSLCHAARYGSTDCIHVLAEHGADVFAVDKDGLSPFLIAEQNERSVVALALKKLGQRQRLQGKRLTRKKLDSEVWGGGDT